MYRTEPHSESFLTHSYLTLIGLERHLTWRTLHMNVLTDRERARLELGLWYLNEFEKSWLQWPRQEKTRQKKNIQVNNKK